MPQPSQKSPHPIDKHVGSRIRMRRALLGVTQQRLADDLGITFQQVQKYERGTNRIGSSRLYEIRRILEVPSSYFFEGAAPGTPARLAFGLAEEDLPFAFEGLAPAPPAPRRTLVDERETLEMVRAFKRIRDPLVRRRLYDLARTLAGLTYRAAGST